MLKSPCEEGLGRKAGAGGGKTVAGPWILAVTILGSSMAFIDGTVVNVALPVLQNALHATMAQVQWVIESYALFLAALLLLGGSLGDRYGRRLVYMTGITVFATASVWCGLSPDIHQLVMRKGLSGGGRGPSRTGRPRHHQRLLQRRRPWTGDRHMVRVYCHNGRRGSVLGGWLVEHLSWRSIFFINIPIAVAVIGLSILHVPESRSAKEGAKLDWPGALLATLALGLLVFGLIESSASGWTRPVVFGPILAGLAFLAAFIVLESRSPSPMMPLGLFRSRTFSGANLVTLFLYTALGGALFFLPFNLIQVQGYSPTEAGGALLPFILLMFFLSRWTGGLVYRYGSRRPLVAGPLIAGCGFALLALPDVGGSYWRTFFPAVCVLGLGMAVSVAPLTTTVMGAAGTDREGIASGINNAVARAGPLLAVAVFGVILAYVFSAHIDVSLSKIDPTVYRAIAEQKAKLAAIAIPSGTSAGLAAIVRQDILQSYVAGFRWVMAASAFLSFLSAMRSWAFLRGKSRG